MLKGIILISAAFAVFQFGAYAQNLSTPPSDNQITKILTTLDEGEIAASEMAVSKSQNKEVLDYAHMMVNDHQSHIKEVQLVRRQSNLSEQTSIASGNMKRESKSAHKDLKKVSAAGFDKLYMDQQVEMHTKALDTLDHALIPNATDASLKDLLSKTRSTVAAHLEKAKMIQSKLQ